MTERPTMPRVPALLDALARDGHIPDRETLETFVLARQGETELPLHIRVLVGIAALIACACFIGFLWKIGVIDYDEPVGMLVSGPVFIVAAIVLNRVSGVSRATIGSFLLQASLAAMATGKLLFILGFSDLFTTSWALSFAALMVTAATYSFFTRGMRKTETNVLRNARRKSRGVRKSWDGRPAGWECQEAGLGEPWRAVVGRVGPARMFALVSGNQVRGRRSSTASGGEPRALRWRDGSD